MELREKDYVEIYKANMNRLRGSIWEVELIEQIISKCLTKITSKEGIKNIKSVET